MFGFYPQHPRRGATVYDPFFSDPYSVAVAQAQERKRRLAEAQRREREARYRAQMEQAYLNELMGFGRSPAYREPEYNEPTFDEDPRYVYRRTQPQHESREQVDSESTPRRVRRSSAEQSQRVSNVLH